jgi:DUF971 family protein
MNDQTIQIIDTEIVNDLLLIQWSDETDSAILLVRMRDNCPCAACAGEKDALGNVYKGPPQLLTEQSYKLNGLQPVGYYGLRPFWADGHTTGIYTIALLQELAAED